MVFGTGGDRGFDNKVTLDDSGAVSGLEVLGEKIEETGEKASESAGGFTEAQASIVSFESAMNIAIKAVDILISGLSTLPQVLTFADEIEDISTGFQAFQGGAEQAKIALEGLRGATEGIIDDLSLMEAANKAVVFGLPTEGFNEAAGAAVKLGESLGKDATEALNAFIQGVGQGNERMLKSIGIFVDAKDGVIDFGEAARQAIEKAGKLPEVALTAAGAFEKLQASYKNAAKEFAEGISQNQALAGAIEDIQKALDSVDFTEFAKGLAEIAGLLAQLIPLAVKAGAALAKAFGTITGAAAEALVGAKFGAFAEDALKNINALSQFGEKTKDTAALLKANVLVLQHTFETYGGVVTKLDQQILTSAQQTVADFAAQFEEAKPPVDEAAAALEGFGRKAKDLGPDLAGAKEAIDKLFDPIFGKGVELFGRQDAKLGEGGAQNILESLGLGDDVLGKGFSDAISGALADGLAGLSQSIVSGGSLRESIGELGGSIGAALGSIGGPIGSTLGQILGDSVGASLKRLGTSSRETAAGLSNLFLDSILPGAGALGIGDKIGDAFFGEHFETTARNNFEDFLEEITGDNFLVREGTDFGSGLFDDFLQNLQETAPEIGAAFSAAGAGFASLIENLDAGQAGAILAENLGGSIFELKALLDTAGISVEQLRESIIQMALDGSSSFAEAAGQLAGLGALAEEGIPGQIGATTEAINELFTASSNRVAIAALEALGDEAIEAGVSLDQALANAAAAGTIPVENIEALGDAIAATGVSAQELADGNFERLIQVLANVESSGFALGDSLQASLDAIDSLDDRLANLPEEVRTKVIIDVQTTGDTEALQSVGVGEVAVSG